MDFETCLPEFDSHFLPEGSELCTCGFYAVPEFYYVPNTHNYLGIQPTGQSLED